MTSTHTSHLHPTSVEMIINHLSRILINLQSSIHTRSLDFTNRIIIILLALIGADCSQAPLDRAQSELSPASLSVTSSADGRLPESRRRDRGLHPRLSPRKRSSGTKQAANHTAVTGVSASSVTGCYVTTQPSVTVGPTVISSATITDYIVQLHYLKRRH